MRYSPSGTHIVFERGQNAADGARRIEVADAATGAVLATFGAGFNPRWLTDAHIVAESPDGSYGIDQDGSGFALEIIPANRGQLDANGHGVWALATVPPGETRVWDDGVESFIGSAREPRLSASGLVAVRHPSTGELRLPYPDGATLGPCEDSRWSSETLVWWLGGRVYGRTTPDQPTVELTVPGRACAHPCPLWTGHKLVVSLVLDDGEIWLKDWNGGDQGWPIGRSDGSGFDIDLSAPFGGNIVAVCYFDPLGVPVYATVDTTEPPQSMLKPEPPEPEPLPDIEWTTDPDGVIADIWPWLRDNATALSPDGKVLWILKSDEVNCEGQTNGEHWDHDDQYIGHLEDSSTGYRWWAAGQQRVNAIDWVNLGEPEPWFNLPLERNCFDAGARLWLPRRCVTGYRQKFTTNIRWTPSGYVQPNIPMETIVDVGYARFGGREAFVRGVYRSSGDGGHTWNDEINYYGPTGWVTHTPAASRAGLAPRSTYVEPHRAKPYGPILTIAPPQPEPPTPEDGMTADELRRWAGEIQDATLFGGMQRYHNEVLPRDRPLDGAIKSAAWTDGDPDFWTGDVVTGGANGYLIRTIMTEYFINRSVGKPAEQAWGEAYDAAKRAYDKAVNPPQPPQPGTLHGPIGVEGKDFVVPS